MTGAAHRFPYREEGNPPILRPTLDIRLQHGATGDWTVRALVDSGAPISVFDLGVAEALGLRLRYAGAITGSIRILGGTWPVQFEDVDLCIPNAPEIEWSARVAFVTDARLQMPFQGLLGTDGFLDQFAITFNKYFDYFVVERPDGCHERMP